MEREAAQVLSYILNNEIRRNSLSLSIERAYFQAEEALSSQDILEDKFTKRRITRRKVESEVDGKKVYLGLRDGLDFTPDGVVRYGISEWLSVRISQAITLFLQFTLTKSLIR